MGQYRQRVEIWGLASGIRSSSALSFATCRISKHRIFGSGLTVRSHRILVDHPTRVQAIFDASTETVLDPQMISNEVLHTMTFCVHNLSTHLYVHVDSIPAD